MEGKEYYVRDMLILEDDRKKKIKHGNDEFVIKVPFPLDTKEIAKRIAWSYDGAPLHSISMDARYLFERDITLDVLIVDHPKWWKDASNCIDEDLKEWLYQQITEWNNEFHEKLKKNKFNKRSV